MQFKVKALGLLAIIMLVSVNTQLALADDNLTIPAPESADQLPSHFDQHFQEEPSRIGATIEELINNSELRLKLRNYYLDRDKPVDPDPQAWAQGGSLAYRVGKIADILTLNFEHFASFPLDADEENDGTLLLKPGQEQFDVLGVANAQFSFLGQTLSLYRQKYDLPFLNSQDNRMVPNTFEGYSLSQSINENKTFQYVAGYINTFKGRNSDDFIAMTDAAGASAVAKGTVLGGARYYFKPNFSLGAINLYTEDAHNIAYAESIYKHTWSEGEDGVVTTFSAQLANQSSVGDDLVRGDDYKTNMWGVQQATSYRNGIIKLAYTGTDTGANFRSPFGSYAGYNSVIVEDFNRAGEQSVQVGISYNFGRWGLKNLSLSSSYVDGFDAQDEITKADVNDKNETDVTIDYRITEGLLNSLWFRVRGAFVDEEDVGTTKDFRVIVNYELPLWAPEKS